MFQWLFQRLRRGAIRVALLSIATIALAGLATWHWWGFLSLNDTPTNTIRTVALIGGGLIAWYFAYWRSSIAEEQARVAAQQADIAKQEHRHGRFERATELLAKQGRESSHARLSGLHALRHLIRDAPDFGPDVIEIITTFMLQASEEQGYEEREFTLARMTAEFTCDTLDREELLDAAFRERLRVELTHACGVVALRLSDAKSGAK